MLMMHKIKYAGVSTKENNPHGRFQWANRNVKHGANESDAEKLSLPKPPGTR